MKKQEEVFLLENIKFEVSSEGFGMGSDWKTIPRLGSSICQICLSLGWTHFVVETKMCVGKRVERSPGDICKEPQVQDQWNWVLVYKFSKHWGIFKEVNDVIVVRKGQGCTQRRRGGFQMAFLDPQHSHAPHNCLWNFPPTLCSETALF